MKQQITIVGAGITGIITAYVLHWLEPSLEITLLDAGPEPKFSKGSGKISGHFGATLGQGRDSRQFTGTEGLSFQNPVHTKLLFELAANNSPGWLTIPESNLSIREKRWREECAERYQKHVKPEHNPYDLMYTTLNYGGMAAWDLLSELFPELSQFRLSKNYVYVAFKTPNELQADFNSESSFNPYQAQSPVTLVSLDSIHENPDQVLSVNEIQQQLLRVPGESWAIQSAWQYLYDFLSSQTNIHFKWDSPVESTQALPVSEVYVWAAGSSYAVPEIYTEHGRVQGIGGWWLSLPNPGFKAPFKFSAPHPNGYINFTPAGEIIHISGGFGWVGEREYQEAKLLLEPVRKHFIQTVAQFFNKSYEEINKYEAGCCIRPTTPTGLPDINTILINNKRHIMISGAGKAGSTQAPLLALHVAQEIGLSKVLQARLKNYKDQEKLNMIKKGLELFKIGFEPLTQPSGSRNKNEAKI